MRKYSSLEKNSTITVRTNDISHDHANDEELNKELMRTQIVKYLNEYDAKHISNNRLVLFLDAFEELDNTLNVFFLEFNEIKTTSVLCCTVWVAMMRTRFILINAVNILLQKQDYLGYEHKLDRMAELQYHLKPLKENVSKCLQYVSLFNLHTKSEPSNIASVKSKQSKFWFSRWENKKSNKKACHQNKGPRMVDNVDTYKDWSFKRRYFLKKEAAKLSVKNANLVSAYRMFLVESYDIPKSKARAFRKHMNLKEQKARKALYKEELGCDNRAGENKKVFNTFEQLLQKFEETSKEATGEHYKNLKTQLYRWYWIFSDTFDLVLKKDIHSYETASPAHENHFKLVSKAEELLELDPTNQIEDNTTEHKGLKSLGPFQLVPLVAPKWLMHIFKNNDVLEYELYDYVHANFFLSWTKGLKGKVSPLSPVTITDPKVQFNMNIARDAKFYRFLFPLPRGHAVESTNDFRNCLKLAKSGSPLHCLLLFGGFAYYDSEGNCIENGFCKLDKPIQVCGLSLGDDLFFDGPYSIGNESCADGLREAGLGPYKATLPGLKKVKGRKFSYIPPEYESRIIPGNIKEEIQESSPEWKFRGAFASIYEKPGLEACYFQIHVVESIHRKKEVNSNTPILEKIKILESRFEEEWAEGDDLPVISPKEKLFKEDINQQRHHTITLNEANVNIRELESFARELKPEDLEEEIKERQFNRQGTGFSSSSGA